MIINTQKQLNSTSRKRNSILNTQKLINSALAVGGMVLMAAGAQAQPGQFNFTTVFTPNPVTSSDPSSFITISNGANNNVNAAGIGSQINLTNFTEISGLIPPGTGNFSTPFNIALTIMPVDAAGSTLTQNFTGVFSGKFNNQQTQTGVTFTAPTTQSFDFTSAGQGIFTVSNLSFTPPGPTGNTTVGAIAAQVTFTPNTPTVPEPASIVPFALGGLALLGLAARKGRRTSRAAA